MQSRQKTAVLFLLFAAFLLWTSAASADTALLNQSIDQGVSVDGTIYALNGSEVYRIDLTGGEEILPAYGRYFEAQERTLSADIASLADWDGRLVLCDWPGEQVLSIENGQVTVLAELVLPGDGSSVYENPVIVDDRLYMLTQSVSGGRLYSTDLTSRDLAQPIGGSYAAIAPWTEGRVLAMRYTEDNTTVFAAVDARGQEQQLAVLSAGIGKGMVSDAAQGTFYVLRGSTLYGYREGTLSQVRTVDASSFIRCAVLVGDQYLLQTGTTCALYDLSVGEQMPLIVRGIAYETTSGFAQDHPEIALTFDSEYSMTAEDVYAQLLMGDDTVDLYLLPYSSSTAKLIERGYAAVLPESDVLRVDAERLHSVYADCLTMNGESYAVAAWALCGAWTMQEEMLDERPATMAEAIDAQVDWPYHEANIGQIYLAPVGSQREWTAMDWMDAALQQIILGRDRDERLALESNAALRQMMTELKETYEISGLPLLTADARTQSVFGGGSVLVTDEMVPVMQGAVNETVNFGLGENTLLFSGSGKAATVFVEPPQILEGEEMRYPAVLGVYILNPRSQHRDAALTYLEWVTQNRSANQRATLYQDCEPEMTSGAQKQLTALEEQAALGSITEQEREEQRQRILSSRASWQIGEEKLSFYQEKMVSQMVVVCDSLLERSRMNSLAVYDKLLEICERYLAGNLSAQQALQNMQQVIDTWWMENQ